MVAQPGVFQPSVACASATTSQPIDLNVAPDASQSPRTQLQTNVHSAPIMATSVAGTGSVESRTDNYVQRGFVTGMDQLYSCTNLDLAIRHMNSVGDAIHEDLSVAELETNSGAALTDASIADLEELCASIKTDIEVKYRDAGVKAARMDLGRTRNTAAIMDDNID